MYYPKSTADSIIEFQADSCALQFLIQNEYVSMIDEEDEGCEAELTISQRREPPASESAITRRTLCAVAAVSSAIQDPGIYSRRAGLHCMNRAPTNSLNYTGRRSLHIQKHTCSSCGYPAAKIRQCTSAIRSC